ncbi:AAA family ATPase [Solihabitans fulvus]|uniref:AAA family ATPase n=1 Tax=Solihabitans fulvus TaxID=1892852 RepID=A0A5B2WYG4_9PSEU|nr:LuxR family transcriptional regulator [Solihabitans fulvus]KAA2255459.1 AAA family ATPase [Solihabitans fulvus]
MAETQEMDGLLADARSGRSAAMVILGEPGVGKSALLAHAAGVANAAGGMRVLRAAGVQSESELPFGALHQLLRPGLDRLGVLPEPQATALRGAFGLVPGGNRDRFLVGLAALSLLAELAGDGPLLCLVDDAHWLDRASADALLFAARRLDAEGVVLVFAARTGGFAGEGLPRRELGGLDRTASRALLDGHAPGLPQLVRDRVLAEAGGNPLALLELPAIAGRARTMTMEPLPLPHRISAAYLQQVAALPKRTRTFLLVAAAEESGDLAVTLRAAASLGVRPDAVEAAERAGLVAVGHLSVTFRHPLVRAAAYQGATSGERRAAHQALAEALVGEPSADRRAWHLAGAALAPDEGIAAGLARTAERARERLGYAAAAAAFERAATLTPDRRTRARRLIAAAESATDAGRPDAAAVLADEASRLGSDPLCAARLASVRAQIASERGELRAAHEILVAAAEPVAGFDVTLAASMLMEAIRFAWAVSVSDLVVHAAGRLGALPAPPGAWTGLLIRAGGALADLLTHQSEHALGPLAELVASARRAGSVAPEIRRFACGVALVVGDLDAAHEIASTLAQECRAGGAIRWLTAIQASLAVAQVQLDHFEEAAATSAESLRLVADTGQPHRVAHLSGLLAWIAAVRGDEERCRELADQALWHATVDGYQAGLLRAHGALAMLELGLGRFDAALEQWDSVPGGLLAHTYVVSWFAANEIEAAVRAGQQARAGELLARFAAWAHVLGQPAVHAEVHRCRALTGPAERAEGHYTEALRLLADGGRPFATARTRALYGEWLRRARRKTEARGQLRAALALFQQLDATPWADRARAELRAAGEAAAPGSDRPDRPDPASATGLLSLLTPQEAQVVRLAATGATNRDIAAQLFLSPRTISHHLYRAFPKLGVASRTELARLDLAGP